MNDSFSFTTPAESLRDDLLATAPKKPFLFVVMHCDRPTLGGGRYDLSGLDLVTIGRGERREATRAMQDKARHLALHLPASAISKSHAILFRDAEGWHIKDAGSRNGCYLNGRRIDHAPLADGDLIEIGCTLLRYRAALPAPPGYDGDLDSAHVSPENSKFVSLVPSVGANLAALARIAQTQIPTLLLGDTGTGKEVLANGIHQLSGQPGPFVAVNCGGLTPSLLESQLFGHVKGSFTGALRDEPGYVRSAERGTLFLDEIAELPLPGQAALLRVLQEHEVVPVGRTRPIRVNVRIVAATHQALEMRCLQGKFRSDLFARLSGYQHVLPPLRDRIEDIGLILADFLHRPELSSAGEIRLQMATARRLLAYTWPLNIRELYQMVTVAIALANGSPLQPSHLPSRIVDDPTEPGPDELEERIVSLLQKSDGNVTEVARLLGKTRAQIHRWMKRFDIDPDDYRR